MFEEYIIIDGIAYAEGDNGVIWKNEQVANGEATEDFDDWSIVERGMSSDEEIRHIKSKLHKG